MRAVSMDKDAAELMGINVDTTFPSPLLWDLLLPGLQEF